MRPCIETPSRPATVAERRRRNRVTTIDYDEGNNEIGNIDSWIIEMTFEGDEVSLSMKDVTGLGGAAFGGRSKE